MSKYRTGHSREPSRRNPDGTPRTDEEYKRAKDRLEATDARKPKKPVDLFTDPNSTANIAGRNACREVLGMPPVGKDE